MICQVMQWIHYNVMPFIGDWFLYVVFLGGVPLYLYWAFKQGDNVSLVTLGLPLVIFGISLILILDFPALYAGPPSIDPGIYAGSYKPTQLCGDWQLGRR